MLRQGLCPCTLPDGLSGAAPASQNQPSAVRLQPDSPPKGLLPLESRVLGYGFNRTKKNRGYRELYTRFFLCMKEQNFFMLAARSEGERVGWSENDRILTGVQTSDRLLRGHHPALCRIGVKGADLFCCVAPVWHNECAHESLFDLRRHRLFSLRMTQSVTCGRGGGSRRGCGRAPNCARGRRPRRSWPR